MQAERWRKLESLYHLAMQQDESRRSAFIESACQDDDEIRRELESLVAREAAAETFLEAPALETARSLHQQQPGFGMIGQQFSHYRLLEKLGAGGMGVVYKAEDVRLARHVALKFLPVEFASDRGRLERFRRESRAASALSHPGICTIFDVGEQDGRPFIVMELLDGQTLTQRIGANALPIQEVLSTGIQIADALQAAHSKGIIHRDIKPANIFLTTHGQTKLLDFGLAKHANHADNGVIATERTLTMTAGEEMLTHPGLALGTLPYMAPEQWTGAPVDARADIYALGVVLFEMATGRRPFDDERPAALAEAVRLNAAPAPRRLNPKISVRLQAIILKCLAKEPANRYQSARDLSADLRALLAPAKSRRRFAAAFTVVLLLMAALLVTVGSAAWRGSWAGGLQRPEIRSVAVLPFDNISGDPEQEYFADGVTEQLITDLAKIDSLRVISRTSVMRYRSENKPVPAIARELGVDAVVHGSVGRSGNRVRISAQLIDGRTDSHLWAESYDRDVSDILQLQSEFAHVVAAEIKHKLSAADRVRLAKRTTTSAQAYEYYIKGMRQLEINIAERAREAVALFEKAVEADPNYALAYARVAFASFRMLQFHEPENRFWLDKAKAALETANRIDPDLGEVHLARSALLLSYYGGYQMEPAVRELNRAIQASPGLANSDLGIVYAHMGLEEPATRELRKGLEVNPLSETNQLWTVQGYYLLGRFDDALAIQSRLFNRPGSAESLIAKGRLEEARSLVEARLPKAPTQPYTLGLYVRLLARQGRFAEAQRHIAKIEGQQRDLSYHHGCHDIGAFHALQGNTREAVRWLREAAVTGLPNYLLFSRDPDFSNIRQRPEFVQFMGELKEQWERWRREFR